MSERIRVTFKTCWRCLGYGEVRTGMGLFSAVSTLGITSLCDLDEMECCPVCDGEGQIPTSVEASDE